MRTSSSLPAKYVWIPAYASVMASLCYNFFFMQPLYTFTIADPRNVSAFLFFMIMIFAAIGYQ